MQKKSCLEKFKLYYEDYNGKRYQFKKHRTITRKVLKAQTA